MNNRLIPCHNCNHSHDSHYNVDDENKFCKYCTCKRCQCIGCRTDIVSRRNPVSSWHKGRIRVATVTYKREKKDKNFYRGYLAAHKKFIEIGQKVVSQIMKNMLSCLLKNIMAQKVRMLIIGQGVGMLLLRVEQV